MSHSLFDQAREQSAWDDIHPIRRAPDPDIERARAEKWAAECCAHGRNVTLVKCGECDD